VIRTVVGAVEAAIVVVEASVVGAEVGAVVGPVDEQPASKPVAATAMSRYFFIGATVSAGPTAARNAPERR
jgi:hypothetical protein